MIVTSRPRNGLGFSWDTFGDALTRGTDSFTKIYQAVRPVPAGCTLVTGPGGQQYTSCANPGEPTPVPYTTFGSGTGMGISPLWLLLGAGGLLLFAKGGK